MILSIRRCLTLVLIAILALPTLASPPHPVHAQPNQIISHTFPQTGKTVSDKFLEYWLIHGGLPQQGFPISNELSEISDTNGKAYTVQYFERAVFE